MSKIILGGISFETKKELTAFIYDLFKKLGKGCVVGPSHNFFVFFFDLLKRHPEFEEKTKNGINSFKLGSNQMHDFVELQIIDLAGRDQPFNWKTCVSGKIKNRDFEIYEAMRTAVIHQTKYFDETVKRPEVCPMCNLPKEDWHVDHKIPFKLIADQFISIHGKPSSFAKMSCHLTTFRIEDLNYEKTWSDFHKKQADLQWLCASCNISKGKKIIVS